MELKLVILLVFSIFNVRNCVSIDNKLFGENDTVLVNDTTERVKDSNILSVTLPTKPGNKVNKVGSKFRNVHHLDKNFDVNDPVALYATFSKETIDKDVQRYDRALNSIKGGTCKEHTKLYIESLRKRQEWALKMYDSTAKDVQGYLSGSRYELGDFDECVGTETHAGDLAEPLFTGQYCLAEINNQNIVEAQSNQPTKILAARPYKERGQSNLTIHWAICLPSTCGNQDVAKFLATYLDRENEFNVSLNKYLCSRKNEIPVTKLDVVYGCIIIAFLSLTILATLVHSFCLYSSNDLKNSQTVLEEIIIAFSISHNLKKIFTLKHSNPNNLDFIGGIRTMAMLFVIGGHSLIFTLFGPNSNEQYILEALQQTYYTIVSNSQLLVETFLLLSGLLMAYMFLIELDKRGNINFIFLYIGRYIRLTPAFIVVIGFYCTWMVRMGSGPLWKKRMFTERDRCLKSWWANILYINNYVSTDNLCMFQSWYLSVDTQLFMIAPFIIYPLWKWVKFGRVLLVISTIFTIAMSFVSHLFGNLDPTILVFASELPDFQFNYYFLTAYIRTHVRAFSYFLGLCLGYTIYVLQKSKVNISRPIVIVSWILAILVGFTSLSSIVVLYDHENRLSALTSATYSISSKLLWNCSIGWIILACLTGNGGIIYKFLTLGMFQPLGRLTYCAFLVNGFIVTYGFASARHNVAMNFYELGLRGVCQVFVSFFCALVLCVLFESPIHGIERILLRSGKRKESSNTTTETVQEI